VKKIFIISILLVVSLSGFTLSGMDMNGSPVNINATTFTGYLSDVMSAESNNGVTYDGVNLKLHPEKHTVARMKTLPSALSGYGILVRCDNGTYSFYRFDKNGITLSKELLKKTEKKERVKVYVTGELKDNILYVETIKEM